MAARGIRIPEGWLLGPREGYSAVEALVLLAVWQIAAARGKALWVKEKPVDVLIAESAIAPAEVALRLPGSVSIGEVASALGVLVRAGEIGQAEPGMVVIPGLAKQQSERFLEQRRWHRRQAAKSRSGAKSCDTPAESKTTPPESGRRRKKKDPGTVLKGQSATDAFLDWAAGEAKTVLGVGLAKESGAKPALKAALAALGDAEVRRRYANYLRTEDAFLAKLRPSVRQFCGHINDGSVSGVAQVNGHGSRGSKTAAFLERLGAGRGGQPVSDVIDVEVRR